VWGPTDQRFNPEAQVNGDLPCQSCGYNLRGARAGGACPECGSLVRDSLIPLSEPEKVASGLRFIGNSYLGLLALPLVPISAAVAGSCAGWVGMIVLLATSAARASGVADLRFRSGAGRMPVVGRRVAFLWLAVMADVVILSGCLLLLLAGAAGGQGTGAVKGLAIGALGLWMLVASAVAAVAGWMGASMASMLGVASLARRLRFQWVLMATGPAVALGLFLLSALLAAIGGAPAGIALAVLTLVALGVQWLVGIGLTLSCMSELARVVERIRDARLEKLGTVTQFPRADTCRQRGRSATAEIG
jgi:hypothetical protein